MSERTAGSIVAERYRLDAQLGAGGMGEVWSAQNVVTGKKVALKFLKPELAARSDVRARFIREARAACAVKHPNVVDIHDVLDVEGASPTMVMELLDGESLAEKLARDGALGLGETCRLLLPVTSALSAVHASGIVHRDLKPDNIFLAKRGDAVEVKVLDFGIAKLTGSASISKDGLTKTGSMLGTPYYMSPEQAYAEKDIDRRSDIWSLGIILYECLTGKRPTETDNFGQILKIITADGIPSIRTAAPELATDVADLMDRMLDKQRSKRPSDMKEIGEVLARHAGEQGGALLAHTGSNRVAFDPTLQASLTPVSGREDAPPPPKRSPRLVLALALLAGVAGIGGAIRFATQTSNDVVEPVRSAPETRASDPPPSPPPSLVLVAPSVPEASPDAPPVRTVVRPAPILDAAVVPAVSTTARVGPKLIEDAPF